MIKNYIRPNSLDESLAILLRDRSFRPLAGGSFLSQATEEFSVVDLQNCGLEYLKKSPDRISIGTMTRLETMRMDLTEISGLSDALNIEAARNVREQSTLGGTIISATGRSPFLTVLLGLDAELVWQPGSKRIRLGNWLAQKNSWNECVILSEVVIDTKIRTAFESIGRSPLDIPVLCTHLTIWASNRMRLAAGGFGKTPMLVLDGVVGDNMDVAIESALSESQDEWASAEYRIHTAKVLAKRSLTALTGQKELK